VIGARIVGSALVAAATTEAASLLAETLIAPRYQHWRRANYRGHEVSYSGGLGAAVGALVAASTSSAGRRALPAGLAAAVAGGYDDFVAPGLEARGDKGLRGHLAAVRAGRVSGGAVKVVVIGAGALATARLQAGRSASLAEVGARAVCIAATANLVNLLDLRPGRAGKVVLAGALGVHGPDGTVAAAATGAAIASLPRDLGERTQLGDLGANTLGALIGARLSAARPGVRAAAAVLATALSILSERVSFSRIIERQPLLRALDRLGRSDRPGGAHRV
jgi:hypothetical protein